MSIRNFTLGLAALIVAAPLAAQQRGTLEFGAFGSAASFDNSLSLDNGTGGGVRFGAFLNPRWSLEFDGTGMSAGRPLGLRSVQVTSLSGRAILTPVVVGRTSWIIGGGAVHTDYGITSSYGMSGLLGAKLALGPSVALRVDGIADYMPHRGDTNLGLRAGVSFFRQPMNRLRTMTVVGPAAPATLRYDSVSATEQRRLRMISFRYEALRDSLARARGDQSLGVSAAMDLATMREVIHFATDSSLLTDASKATLDSKVGILRANPAMRIVIVGNTDERATDAYNMALGGRRADAAKAYLVSHGIAAMRIDMLSLGESQPTAVGTSPAAQARNRRAEFRLFVASDSLPRKQQR
jgi:peptidoglycan-associated lipoprotein